MKNSEIKEKEKQIAKALEANNEYKHTVKYIFLLDNSKWVRLKVKKSLLDVWSLFGFY